METGQEIIGIERSPNGTVKQDERQKYDAVDMMRAVKSIKDIYIKNERRDLPRPLLLYPRRHRRKDRRNERSRGGPCPRR